jgi:hypothetical protein
VASSPLTGVGIEAANGTKRSRLSLALLFVLPALIFGGLVAYGHFKPTKAAALKQGTPGSLVWGDGKVIFSNKEQLAAWLKLHGSSYRAFVKKHPEALRLVSKHPQPPATVPTRPAAKTAAKPAKTATAPQATTPKATTPAATTTAATASSGGGSRAVVFSIAAALGLLLGVLALLPHAYLRRIGFTSSLERERDLRFSAGALSVAILAGVAFAVLVG